MGKRKHLGGVFWEREQHATLVFITTNKLHRTILTTFYIFTKEKKKSQMLRPLYSNLNFLYFMQVASLKMNLK